MWSGQIVEKHLVIRMQGLEAAVDFAALHRTFFGRNDCTGWVKTSTFQGP